MIKKDTPQTRKSESIENLLFSGMIYRIISEPEGLRDSMSDMSAFLDEFQSSNLSTKLQEVDSAMGTIDRIKDRNGTITAFETVFEGSPYSMIIFNDKFEYVFHNEKSELIINTLFSIGKIRRLNSELIAKIENQKNGDATESLITVPKFLNDNISAYLITEKSRTDNERSINILLIPDSTDNKFELQNELVTKYHLTKKEQLVLTNLVSGCNVNQVADQFHISLNTVRSHLKSIFRKTHTKSQSALIRLFLNNESGLIDSYFGSAVKAKDESEDQFITLSTGNKLCYREYGPKDGRPLIIFHNFLGSRFNIPTIHSEILLKTNRRIIIPDRPGYGKSDVFDNYIVHWNEMVNEFIEKLAIQKFDLLGYVSGSSLAIAYASAYPSKITSVILTSTLFFNTSEQKNLLHEFPRTGARITSSSQALAKRILKLWIKSMTFDTERYMKKMIKKYSGSAETDAIEKEGYVDRIVLNFKESQRNNSNGSAQDAVYTLMPLNLDLSKVMTPFNIWIGDEDSLISVSSAKKICEPLPNKTFHVRKGYGEEIFYHLFEEIIQ